MVLLSSELALARTRTHETPGSAFISTGIVRVVGAYGVSSAIGIRAASDDGAMRERDW